MSKKKTPAATPAKPKAAKKATAAPQGAHVAPAKTKATTKPTLAKQISITPPMPVFGVMAIGNLLAIASSEQSRIAAPARPSSAA